MNTDRTNPSLALLAGVGIGAALMYFLDPHRGTRRRHLVADQATSTARTLQRHASDLAAGSRDHARGAVAELRGRMRDETVTDDRLVARVRAALGHHVEHARAIEVVADGGTVTLRGSVLADELSDVVGAIGRVRGVERVDNQLDVRATWNDASPARG